MDLPEVMDGGQTILRSTAPDGGETVVLTAAGMIGLTGCNSDGLGVCVNTLSMLNHSRGRACRWRSCCAACSSGARWPGPRRSCAPSRMRRASTTRSGPATTWPASSARRAGSSHPTAARAGSGTRTTRSQAATSIRPTTIRRGRPTRTSDLDRLAETGPEIESADDCEQLLADKRAPLCVAPEAEHNWLTFGSIAMELSSPPAVRIAPGPPDRTPGSTPRPRL